VYDIVRGCTNAMPDEDGSKGPTELVKARYVEHLRTASSSVCLVSASDKLHNARSIVADLRTDGDALWSIFRMGKVKQLAYYEGLVLAFRDNPGHNAELVAELDRTVAVMHALAGQPYPAIPG
jgi:GTP pyrophosphokinase